MRTVLLALVIATWHHAPVGIVSVVPVTLIPVALKAAIRPALVEYKRIPALDTESPMLIRAIEAERATM
jgi:hypothetical protein